MSFAAKLNLMFSRKIAAAAISVSLFSILLAIVWPNPFGENIDLSSRIVQNFSALTVGYLIYSFPVIIIYGTITSLISDLISHIFQKHIGKNGEVIVSLVLHLFFGLILWWLSLFAAFLFFLTDRFLLVKDKRGWGFALQCLCLPILLWIILNLLLQMIS
ncbi:hypothetical protein [Metabacillus sp. RGM 3146]|uniref:hypothetical protein n=1 Tax=Metabacillus sp. RGM 3146 TaxID=3401092 RepID=UPI003B9C0D0F